MVDMSNKTNPSERPTYLKINRFQRPIVVLSECSECGGLVAGSYQCSCRQELLKAKEKPDYDAHE
jgi:hypothetical protein